jgi:hypothetical protein
MASKTPQKTRAWYPKYGPHQFDAVRASDGTYTIGGVRNFVYRRDGSGTESWLTGVPVNTNDVVRTWYLLEPFTRFAAIAHPYFVFEMQDGSVLCFTIEGKRLSGEPYSALRGMLSAYELGYIWTTGLDCITMPLTRGALELYAYPLTLTPHESKETLRALLDGTHTLHETPEFYHTILNNCTIRFAHTIRAERIRPLPFDLSWYLPGWSDRYFMRTGLIAPTGDYREARRAHDLVRQADTVWGHIESHGERAIVDILKSAN